MARMRAERDLRTWILGTFAGIALIVVAAAIWASADPDGLERIAQDLGFSDAGQEPGFQILPDYTFPGLDGVASTIVAGLIGVAIVVMVMVFLGRLMARRRSP